MVAPSKLFEWPLKDFHCSQLPFHCGKTCFQSFLDNCYRITISNLVYYSPLALTPIVSKGTKISIENMKESFKFYMETTLASSTVGTLTLGSICLLRNLTGEFKLWMTLVLGPYLVAQTCWFFPKRTLRLFLMATSQTSLEALIRQHKCSFTYFLLNSKAIQTLIFMASSSIIMHYKHLGLYNGFWFIKSELLPTEKREIAKDKPIWSLFQGCKGYFVYGVLLDILNTVIKRYSSYKKKELTKVIWAAIKGLRLNMTCFFISYAGIYKLALHYLPKYMPDLFIMKFHQAAAAFLGGASYMFLNKLTCNTFAIILAVQLSWHKFCQTTNKNNNPKYVFLNILKKIPFAQIIFPLNLIYIIYSYVYRNESVNSLGKNVIRAVTDKKIQRLFDYLRKNGLDYLVRDCSLKPLLGAF